MPLPPDADPSFEVATIKPSDTTAPHGTGIRSNGNRVAAFNFSIGELIAYSYGLHAKQIIAEASFPLGTHFDIEGVPNFVGHPNITQSRRMFQRLLVSRFKLEFRYESRELSAYVIQVAKGGPKLVQTTRKPSDRTGFSYNCQVVLTVRNASIADVARGMQEAFMDKPVVDQTGLHDRYDFDLKWTPDESQSYCPVDSSHSNNDPEAPPGLYTAIQEQIGLKLVPTKASVQVMVIDHIEAPSEN
ncbi:TIGR03435 family protein [Terriglobus albidus]|uniref:TIGR03435 family protein n=1 Tax=Terriglobus albidus TaxID=1592106 RepID=UPI00164DFB1E|nr:TIGR03435 family protein [Terriglobus albidus]